MMRALTLLFVAFIAGCGSDVSFFSLRLVGSETVIDRNAITLDAVDEVRISIDPAENIVFDMRPQMVFEDGGVTSHVSSAGEFIITLSRAYLQAHAIRNDVGFSVDIALTMESVMVGELADPGLFVEFIQRNNDGTEILGSFRRALTWPIIDDSSETVTVGCFPGLEAKCLNERP